MDEEGRDFGTIEGQDRPPSATLYHMIETFNAENFRGFRKLHLDGLKTINIIVGRSGAGKTALLEALRLAFGATPAVAWNLNGQRGFVIGVPANPTRKQFESPWASLFFGFATDGIIKFSAMDSDKISTTCKIYFDTNRQNPPVIPQPNVPVLPDIVHPLAFERTSGDSVSTIYAEVVLQTHPQFWAGQPFVLNQVSNYQMQMQPATELGPVCEFFSANVPANLPSIAQKYSELNIAGLTAEIEATITEAFPDITSIQTETPAPGIVSLYAAVNYQKNRVPLALYSAGMSKFITLLVEI